MCKKNKNNNNNPKNNNKNKNKLNHELEIIYDGLNKYHLKEM